MSKKNSNDIQQPSAPYRTAWVPPPVKKPGFRWSLLIQIVVTGLLIVGMTVLGVALIPKLFLGALFVSFLPFVLFCCFCQLLH